MALEYGDEVFISDLVCEDHTVPYMYTYHPFVQGGDKIWRLIEDGSPGNWKIQGQIDQPGGSGPRHMATHGA